MNRLSWFYGLLVVLAACRPQDNGGDGSETHWLQQCQSSAECGAGSCVCGVCSVECNSDVECPSAIERCETDSSTALFEGCTDSERPSGICTDERASQATESDDSSGRARDGGRDATEPSGSDATRSDSETDSEAGTESDTDSQPGTESDAGSASDPESTSTETSEPTDPDSGQPPIVPPVVSGDVGPSALGFISPAGSRLLGIALVADGLEPMRVGIWDSEQEVECDFVRAEDDQLRCLPRNATPGLLVGYSDASCTTRAFIQAGQPWDAVVGVESEAQPMLLSFPLDECSTTARYAVDQVVQEQTDFYVLNADGNCFAQGLTSDFVSVGSVAAERWQAGALETRDLTDGFAATRISAGASAFDTQLASRALSAPCSPVLDGSDPVECLPAHAWGTGYFYADATCAEPLAMGDTCEREFAVVSMDGANFVRPIVGEHTGDAYYAQGGECGLQERDAEQTPLFTLGEAIPAPQLTLSTKGDTRLRQGLLLDGDAALMAANYYDAERGQECEPRATASGEIRCLPPIEYIYEPGQFEAFTDLTCTTPTSRCEQLMAIFGPDGFEALYEGGTEPSAEYAVYTWQDVGGVQTCLRDDALSSGGARTPHCTRGPELPLDSFPLLQRVVIQTP